MGPLIAVELVVGGVITVLAMFSGAVGWFGYGVTAVYLFLVVALGYFQFMKPSR